MVKALRFWLPDFVKGKEMKFNFSLNKVDFGRFPYSLIWMFYIFLLPYQS
jgi:hypothetical protein